MTQTNVRWPSKPVALVFTLVLCVVVKPALAQVKMPKRGICAHRGASDTHPENTLAAIKQAIALGAQMIEFDVALTKDGKLVLMHDSTINRTTNGTGPVSAKTLAELKKLDAGGWKHKRFKGERIPTLQEALAVMPENIWLNIHLKGSARLSAEVTKVVVTTGRLHQSFLACGAKAVKAAKQTDTRIQVCNMERQANTLQYVNETIAMKAEFIQLLGGKVARSNTDKLRKQGVRINYCCSNDGGQVQELLAAGVEFPLVDRVAAMMAAAKKAGIKPLVPVYRSRLKGSGLKTPLARLIESKRLAKGAASQGLAISPDHFFSSNAGTICKFDKKWRFLKQQRIKIPLVNHVGAIDYHQGYIWAGLLNGPSGGKYDAKKNRGVIAKIRASDLTVVKTWDVTKQLTWIDPVCFDGKHIWVGDLSDLGIHKYRIAGDKLVRVGTLKYPGAMHFSQGVRIRNGKLYSIHTFGSMDGLFEFDLPKKLSKGIVKPRRVWHIAETHTHAEGFAFVPGTTEIWHAQSSHVDRYKLDGLK